MYVLFANDSLIYDFFSNKIQKKKNCSLQMESMWSPYGFQVESLWSPGGVQPYPIENAIFYLVQVESRWSPDGIGGAG